MATEITTTDLQTQFGSFYKNEGQSVSDIYQIRNYSFETANSLTRRVTNDTKVKLMHSHITNILQPYQDTFTPNGELTIEPHEFDLFNVKADIEFTPDQIKDTYAGFLASDSTLDRSQWPMIRFAMEVHLKKILEENFEMQAIWNGVSAAPTPGTAGAPNTSMDGLAKIIADYITAGKITPIVTGALSTTATTFVDQVYDMVKSIDVRYRSMNMTLHMDMTNFQLFKEGMDEKYNTNYLGQNDLTSVRLFPNITVKGLNSMNGSSRLWCTPEGNGLFYTKGVNMLSNWKIETETRKVRLFTDGYMAANFAQPALVFCNDQA